MESLRNLIDIIKYHHKPTSWTDWRRMVIKGQISGIDRQLAPKMFYMSQGLLEVFDEMLPVRNGRIDDSKESAAVKKALMGLEVARALVIDSLQESLLVQSVDDGVSGFTSRGAYVRQSTKPGQIGSIHTHPIDIMSSSGDIANILTKDLSTIIIVTPIKVITLFRSLETPFFTIKEVVDGYLTKMGVSKGRIRERSINLEDNLWTFNYQDLDELKILGYEAKRGERVFIRKTV